MRIISFSERWQKLSNLKFTTFRFPRKDRDWQLDEAVQVYYKNRSPLRERLGIAQIVSKEAVRVADITEDEASEDGFHSAFEMWVFLGRPFGKVYINKLTLHWLEAK